MTDEELIDAYLAYQRGREFSPKTIQRRLDTLDGLRRLIAPSRIVDMTTADIEEWLRTKRAPRTRAAYRSDLKMFFKWAHRRKLVDHDPTELIDPIRIPKSLPRPLGEDVHVLLMTGSRRVRQMVGLAMYAGLRCAEIANLDGSDVMADSDPPSIVVRNGKGSKDRVIPMHPVLVDLLADVPRVGPVFESPATGVAMLPHSVGRAIVRHMRACGVAGTPHQLRHTFGTNFAKAARGDILMVASVMGHGSPTTTMGYVAFDNTGAAETIGKLYGGRNSGSDHGGNVVPIRRVS